MPDILSKSMIRLQAKADSKESAIRMAGELLVAGGCVAPSYVEGMLAREKTMSTYIGNGVAIPHGQYENLADVKRTGISVVQIPAGVLWEEEDEEVAYLVVGIAARSDEHMGILAALAEAIEEEETVEMLANTDDAAVILEHLNRDPEAD